MSISYSKELRAKQQQGQTLVSIDAGGPTWQGWVGEDLYGEILEFFLQFVKKAKAQATATAATPPTSPNGAKPNEQPKGQPART